MCPEIETHSALFQTCSSSPETNGTTRHLDERSTRSQQKITDQNSLRILRVAQSVFPEFVGGIEVHVDELSRYQAKRGHEVTVLTSDNGDRSLPRKEFRDGYTLLRHAEIARPFDNSITPGIVRNVLDRSRDHDIVDIHSHLYFSSNVAAMLGSLSGTSVIVTNHGLVSQTAPEWIQRIFNRTVGRLTFGSADRIICLSETDRSRVRDLGVGVPVTVIPSGIDTDLFSPDTSIERKEKILFVGRLKARKGPHYLIEAFSSILDTYPEYSLKLVGDGPMRNELVELSKQLSIEEKVHFDRNLPIDDLVREYNESQVFVLPSLSEGLPRTLLEALACETPAVVTELDQLIPVVQGAGTTVAPKASDQLASEISILLADDDKRRRFGKTGRERVVSSYTWEQTARKTIECYYEAI